MSPVWTRPISGREPTAHSRSGNADGFTLVELLVVLAITALISGVLLTALGRVLDIRLRIAEFLDGVEAPVLVADWFRSSVEGLVPDNPTGHDRFIGRSRKMTGLSLAPVNSPPGVPTPIAWEIVYEADAGRSYLRYRNGGDRAMTLASWPGDYGALRYCGADLVCHDSWPADRGGVQLPALIRLDAVKGTEPWPILAAPESDRDPLPGRR